MFREIIYRNIAYFGGLMLIVGLFINFSDLVKKGLFDILYDTIALTTFTFAYLWIKKRILLVGLLFYTIDFNIGLLFNPIVQVSNTAILASWLKWTGITFHIAGFICLLLGFWENLENKYLSKTLDIGVTPTLSTIALLTGLVQGALRII